MLSQCDSFVKSFVIDFLTIPLGERQGNAVLLWKKYCDIIVWLLIRYLFLAKKLLRKV